MLICKSMVKVSSIVNCHRPEGATKQNWPIMQSYILILTLRKLIIMMLMHLWLS
jgi:hypothetical protein